MPRAGASGVPPPPAAGARGTDLKTGYLEKRIGEHSTRSSLPDAFRWQRRYFVLTESKGMLYYFKSPDDPPNYKGVLSLRDCRVDDLDADGSVRGGSGSAGGAAGSAAAGATRSSVGAASGGKYDLDGGAGGGNASAAAASSSASSLSASTGSLPVGSGASLLFRISHRDPTRAVYKNHASLVLRAESASEKYSWLARLRAAAANAASAPPLPDSGNPAASPRAAAAGPLASGAAKRAGGGGANGSGDGGGNPVGRRSSADAAPSASSPPQQSVPAQPRPASIPASGIGSALAHGVSSKLGPEPPYVYGPSSSSSSSSSARDAFLEALGADTASYVRTVCATIAVTVPKAAVHCQVKRAQGHLLEALYAAVSSLPPDAASGLLAEDGDAGARRAAAAAQSVALADAYGRAAAARDRAVSSGEGTVALPASVVEIAGGRGGSGSSNGGRVPPPRVSVVTSGNDNTGGSAAPTPTSTTSPSPMPRRRPPPAPPSDIKMG